jgi:hypothetical protein
MRIIGVILIVAGLLGFVVSSITYTERETVLDVGPLEVQKERERTIPIGPIGSGLVLAAGVVFVIVGSRTPKT